MSGEKPELLRKGRAKAGAATLAEFALRPDPADPRLTERVSGLHQDGRAVETAVLVERPLTQFLNGQELVTLMTIDNYPDDLAVVYLLNKHMLYRDVVIAAIARTQVPDVHRVTNRARQSSAGPPQ